VSSTATTTVRARRGKTYLPPKNRVGGFSSYSETSARFFVTQAPESHRENEPTPTTTASGMRFYGFRFYSPQLGRWLSRDPIEEIGSMNLYSFVRGDPLLNLDILGLMLCNDAVIDGSVSASATCCGKNYNCTAKYKIKKTFCCNDPPPGWGVESVFWDGSFTVNFSVKCDGGSPAPEGDFSGDASGQCKYSNKSTGAVKYGSTVGSIGGARMVTESVKCTTSY
jgi:RHS repeat-associated protein